MDVFDDAIRISRRCFVSDRPTGPDWTIPLPAPGERPFAHGTRAAADPAPRFPAGAKAMAVRAKGKDRYGTETDQVVVSFPPANSTDGSPRAFDYEVQPVLLKYGLRRFATAKRVYAPGIIHPEELDRGPVTCVFAEAELPNDVDSYEFVVTPFNAFGRRGESLTVNLAKRK